MYLDEAPGSCVLGFESLGEKFETLSLADRFRCCALKVATTVSQLGPVVMYDFPPFLVANGVNCEEFVVLPSVVLEYKVKSQLVDGRLFILDITTNIPHGTGSIAILSEVSRWSNNHKQTYFGITSDSMFSKGDGTHGCYAPDCVIFVGPKFKRTDDNRKVGKHTNCSLCLLVRL